MVSLGTRGKCLQIIQLAQALQKLLPRLIQTIPIVPSDIQQRLYTQNTLNCKLPFKNIKNLQDKYIILVSEKLRVIYQGCYKRIFFQIHFVFS